jgi:hypothetical protein
MGIGGASAAYERMWSAWRGGFHGLAGELDAQVARLLRAIASYDLADRYAYLGRVGPAR